MNERALKEELAKVRPNAIDRLVNFFDPERGQRRQQARLMMAVGHSYTGASRSRRSMQEWRTTLNASADADLLPDLPTLRDRSRDLVRNNPIAGGAINTVVTSVVGTGLMLQSQVDRGVLGFSQEQAAEWQRQAELEFRLWQQDSDITRTQDFYEQQDLVFRGSLESGDIFVLTPHVRRPGSPYGLKLQVIESDRVSNPKGTRDTSQFCAGVEMDKNGAPVAYHIQRSHPGDLTRALREWDRVDAFGKQSGRRNVLHLYKRLRPGQTRGEPYLAPVIEPLKQLGRYTEAEIMAAVVAGMFTVFVKSETGAGLAMGNQTGMGRETGAKASDTDAKLGYGAMVDLADGEDISTANPGRPNTAFDPFVLAIMRQIGMRLELPFEVLVKHFTASYSAARAALLEAWRFYKVRRAWLASKYCQPVYELFLEEAIAIGRLSAPGFFRDPLVRMAYCGSEWHGDGAGSIDPASEAKAAQTRMDIGLTTLKKETAEYDGGDWEQNHEQQVKEKAARGEGGLLPGAQPGAQHAPPAEENRTIT